MGIGKWELEIMITGAVRGLGRWSLAAELRRTGRRGKSLAAELRRTGRRGRSLAAELWGAEHAGRVL